MWIPLLINILGYYIVAAYLVLGSMRAILVERERRSSWVKNWLAVVEFQFESLMAFLEMAPTDRTFGRSIFWGSVCWEL